ncbi:alpha/beta hydrolase [Marinifilum caeruleilacunae]|uniref:Alpha/beta hydrolase n=1 Tax=Marinifilum caeruleilacunae TaxID=2499076 RepID=A0ABX1WPY4_9BACT|nr:alpha/beta hydrolase-fold protein [Marinifilum caeruleilacunae]NOU58184.1 alpha/beta hydrolase [Marinifilum caeruleilacunae]
MRLLLLLLLSFSLSAYAQLPDVASGTIKRFENFESKYIVPRNVDVWLPDGYSKEKEYSVLYMHDGQMLYDANKSWNKQEWMVDEVVSKLINEKTIDECIVVGVWNGGAYRHSDYFPEKAANYLPKSLQSQLRDSLMGDLRADEYLKFLTKELKPFIDKTFSVKTDKEHTFIAGSSMGGLISMYAICEYPNVFEGAACISTHWPGDTRIVNNLIPEAFYSYLKDNLPSPKNHKIYFDYGTETLDSLYKPLQLKVDEIMRQKGFTSENWVTKEFVGENHSEDSWCKRLHIPLTFIMKK